ncbi:hypothetical protein C4544_07055 [candidate division WS5 bacterium]|uniref:Uncharacterized protein n=1 Tax=candidate division WS5 bacterium TaxID=2093353 RepID=A0A419DAH5_9BACT|nr:MAG: hypothetical protein C4544_07055 [candidate division WS5 bacterium]
MIFKKMKTDSILIYLAVLFTGYVIGRLSHILGGQINGPHHWIFGIILIIIGVALLFYKKEWSLYLIFFGVGLTISDLRDMLELKFWGVDPPGPKRFWHID